MPGARVGGQAVGGSGSSLTGCAANEFNGSCGLEAAVRSFAEILVIRTFINIK